MRALVLSVSMFSVLPVRRESRERPVDAQTAGPALLWLPALGALLGAIAVLPVLAVWRGHSVGTPLLGSVLAVVALAGLTRGLHLDGLADLADGLGSRRPADAALEVMARSDIGPFGVAAIMGALLLQIAALSSILAASSRPAGVVVVVAVAAIGRVAALWAAGRGVPAARPGGFGALVAGSASWAARASITVAVVVATLACAWWAGLCWPGLTRLAGSAIAALVLSWLVRRHAIARLGGMTGDVFGALIEITVTAVLVFYAGALAWR